VSLRICSRDIPVHLLSDLPPTRRPLQKKNWRRGQESNLPRLLRTDNGFEDREGHQAPVTLRTEKENVEPASAVDGLRRGERPTSNAQHRTTKEVAGLFELFDRRDHGVEIGPFAGLEFRMEQFSIGLDFESAAT
jgi:hypothetical protein